ncbi:MULTISPECIES: PKD domain-containing protein, partial [unclassified Streptomyces]|uniref:PKD domain-containing protein n=1 Tax=unclassified Streptomyces TaxID=2593676 RepID=UPI0033269FD7
MAAAKVVEPGQTVRIKPGGAYDEAVVVDRSGAPGLPITFTVDADDSSVDRVYLSKSLTIKGASHVAVRGFYVRGGIQVTRSADVELDRIQSHLPQSDGLVVREGSTDVLVSRSIVWGARIEGGSQRTVLSRNELYGSTRSAVTVVDSPGTAVTNNTLTGVCGATVSVSGGSDGSGLFNNVVFSEEGASGCQSTEPRKGISVSQSAASGIRADYNLFVGHGEPVSPYSWSGTDYASPAAFHAATGQGAQDLLPPEGYEAGSMGGPLAIDSADPSAPGVLPTDPLGNPIADDPGVPNTGKGGGFLDRGAYEAQDHLSKVSMSIDKTWAPVGTEVRVEARSDSLWPTAMTYQVDFGDGTAPVYTRQGDAEYATATHVYSAPCECMVKVTAVNGVGVKVSTEQSTKVTPAGPLTAAFTARQVLPTSNSPYGSGPLTARFDARSTTAPWPVSGMDIDFGDGTTQHDNNLDLIEHSYSKPGEYTATLTVHDTQGTVSTASRKVKVDYAASGYVATEPFRLLDTRSTHSLIGSERYPVDLPVGFRVPGHTNSGGMSAAVLNVTVADATEDTHLSVWPSGQPQPATSNVNVRKGGTSSNTVTVPVGADGRVVVKLNSGYAALVVDFVGYYQPNVGQRFSPIAPTRVADTRATGGALGGGQTRTVKVAGVNGVPADATAIAFNLTGTGSTENAHVIAYPDPAKRPATSNLNLEPGKDKSNQAIVPVGPDG